MEETKFLRKISSRGPDNCPRLRRSPRNAYTAPCNQPGPCGACFVKSKTQFLLKGICDEATKLLKGKFDRYYHFIGMTNGQFHFRYFTTN